MSLEVIAFVPHPEAGPSSRYRVFAMVGPLAGHGVRLDVRPFLDDRAIARLYDTGRVATKVADLTRGAVRRWADLVASDRYQLALVHRELWPLVGEAPLRRLAQRQPRWIFDFDDAVWLPNVSVANRAFVRLKPFDQPKKLAAGARAISAGNTFLADWARRQRPDRPPEDVEIIPTAVDTDRWRPQVREPGPARLAWIGSPSTVGYLEPLRAPLARLGQRHPGLELHVIGAGFKAEGVRVVNHAWSAATEVALVARCDVGLAPLPDTEWARGKCGLKVLLYMACGLPVVAARVGVHTEMVTHEADGWLSDSPGEFEPALAALLEDAGLRARLGTAARATVEARYSLRAVAPRLAALLRRAAEAP